MRKNVNPKSLKGNDQLDRVRELMGKMQPLNESTSLSELELIKKGPNNVIYGIVRENHKYFIKTTNKTSGTLVAEDFDYIGGLQNKFSEAYNSYAAVTKQLNLKFDMLNESLGIDTHNNILESDGIAAAAGYGFVIEEEEVVEEESKPDFLDLDKDGDKEESMKKAAKDAKNESDEEKLEEKTVLKVDAPAPAEPEMEEPIEDEVPMEDDMESPVDAGMDMEEPAMDDEGDDEEDSTKKIQKLTGKIGQAIRELDEPDAELEKYVINSVISALHLDEFSDEDIEDIIAKLEGEEEEDEAEAAEAGEMDMEEPSMEEEPAEEETEEEVEEVAESVSNKPTYKSVKRNDGKYEIHMKTGGGEYVDFKLPTSGEIWTNSGKGYNNEVDANKAIDSMKETKDNKMSVESVTYTKSQLVESLTKKLVKESIEEHHMGDSSPGQYDINAYRMEEGDSMYVDCPECMGEGCSHCDDLGYHLSNEDNMFDSEPELHGDDFMALDIETGRQRPTDRDGDEIPSYLDMDADGDDMLDDVTFMEDDGYGVDVLDSVSGTFDMDKDGIPAHIDNIHGDGEKVDIMNYFDDNDRKTKDMSAKNLGLDIEYFSGQPSEAPNPGVAEPAVRPNTPPKEIPKRGPWTTPKTKPNPKAVKEGDDNSKPKRSFRRIGGYRK